MKKLMIIINPVAGRGDFRPVLGEICEEFFFAGYEPQIYFTSSAGDAKNLAAAHGKDFSLVVCLGGDGTFSEVVSGLVGIDNSPPLGYIPLGTTNDMSKNLKLPKNPLQAARQIIDGRPIPLDIGKFGADEYFSYIAAFGAFTEISYATSQEMKHSLGHMAYLLEGMLSLSKIRSYHTKIEFDGGGFEGELVFGGVSNTTSVAGLLKLDESIVKLHDGKFELILVKNPNSISELNKIISGLLTKNYSSPYVMLVPCSRARFIFDEPVAWTKDGENGGEHSEITIENLCSAINIMA